MLNIKYSTVTGRIQRGKAKLAEYEAAQAQIEEAKKTIADIVANGFDKVDFSALAETYPNVKFSFVEAEELTAEEGVSGFYRLKAEFIPSNEAK